MVRKVKGLDIKIARIKSGLRQYDVAARLGIPASRLSEIESGRRQPEPEILNQICSILGEGISQQGADDTRGNQSEARQ